MGRGQRSFNIFPSFSHKPTGGDFINMNRDRIWS